jgi:hypothetical protein
VPTDVRPDDRPLAVRAVASVRPSRWRGRQVRVCRYDALHHDGRVETDVRITVMYRRSPADFETVSRTVHHSCPEVGTGAWVDATGRLVGGPGPLDHPGRLRNGRRVPWPAREARTDPRRAARWRAALGAVAVVTGILLLVGTEGDGPLAAAGALLTLCGSAALATAVRDVASMR